MTKLSFAFLFLFFTLSLARTPFTLPENDVTHLKLRSENDVILPELPKNLPGNDVTQLNIPLENDFVSHEFPNTLPESDDSTNTVNLPSKFDHEETRSVHPVPLKLVRFRPINRRFRLRSNLPFLLCHHHLKPRPRRQIQFGNDMILSSQRNVDFDKFVYRIGVEQIPSDPFNFHQHKISKFPNDREKIGEMKKDQSPHHHHRHDNDDNEDNDHQQRKISKFLEDREKFGEMKLKDQSHHHHHHYDDNEDNDHEQRKISKFLEDHEKFWGMNLKDQSPYHHHHHHDEKAKEKKKGGFMRGIRKFLHHYFD